VSPVAAGLAILLASLNDADKLALAGLLLAGDTDACSRMLDAATGRSDPGCR
jgi:hypothetical protein